MRLITLSCLLLLTIASVSMRSCGNKTISNNKTQEKSTDSIKTENKNVDSIKTIEDDDRFVIGKITTEYKKDGCEFLIKSSVKGKDLVYCAINLDESLKLEGKNFQFRFRPIKAPRKGPCRKGIYIFIEEFK